VHEDATVDDVLSLMSNSEVRRVPVVNKNDELVGIVSIGDISFESNESGKVGDALGDISEARPNN
jgi:CBS domain-containing protein